MKLYNINRVLLFSILAQFPSIQMQRIGTVWAEGFITDGDAEEIQLLWPRAISLYYPVVCDCVIE